MTPRQPFRWPTLALGMVFSLCFKNCAALTLSQDGSQHQAVSHDNSQHQANIPTNDFAQSELAVRGHTEPLTFGPSLSDQGAGKVGEFQAHHESHIEPADNTMKPSDDQYRSGSERNLLTLSLQHVRHHSSETSPQGQVVGAADNDVTDSMDKNVDERFQQRRVPKMKNHNEPLELPSVPQFPEETSEHFDPDANGKVVNSHVEEFPLTNLANIPESMDKRFMKGVEHYLKSFANRPKGRRADVRPDGSGHQDENKGDESIDDDNDVDVTKRFMKGIEKYLQKFTTDRTLKSHLVPGGVTLDKRFLKGITDYLKNYANRFPHKRTDGEHESLKERVFLNDFDMFLQKYANVLLNQKPELEHDNRDDERELEAQMTPIEKRFMKGIDVFLKLHPKAPQRILKPEKNGALRKAESKRFLKGFNPYIRTYTSAQSSKRQDEITSEASTPTEPAERMEENMWNGDNRNLLIYDGELDNRLSESQKPPIPGNGVKPDVKRMLKGSNEYLHNYLNNPSSFHEYQENARPPLHFSEPGNGQMVKDIHSDLQMHPDLYPLKRFMETERITEQTVKPANYRVKRETSFDYIHDQDDLNDLDDLEQIEPSKRFFRAPNPYLHAYMNSRLQKRFLKGSNPFLQKYLAHIHDNDDDFSGSKGKRFLKGADLYLKLLANHRQGKRNYIDYDDDVSLMRERRFLKGVNPYLFTYSNRPDADRYSMDEDESPESDDEVDIMTDKRFLKGANNYLKLHANRYLPKRGGDLGVGEGEFLSPTKRFFKGMNRYLKMYASRLHRSFPAGNYPRVKRHAESLDNLSRLATVAHFLRNDNEFPLKNAKLNEPEESSHDLAVDKRFLKGVDPYLKQFSSRHRNKKFTGRNDPTLTETDSEINTLETEGLTSHLNAPEDKRFMKGIDAYLKLYVDQSQSKRHYRDSMLPWTPVSPDINDLRDKKFYHTFQQPAEQGDSGRHKRQAGLLKNEGDDNFELLRPEHKIPLVRHFLKGNSQNLRHHIDLYGLNEALYRNSPKPSGSVSFPTAYVHSEVGHPEVPNTDLGIFQAYDRRTLPSYGARQFMTWINGKYRQG